MRPNGGPLDLGPALRALASAESPLRDKAYQSPVYDRLKLMSWKGLKSDFNDALGLCGPHRYITVRLIAVHHEPGYLSSVVHKSRLLQMNNDSKSPWIMP